MNPISHRRPAAVTRVLDTFKCLLLSPAVSCGMAEMAGQPGVWSFRRTRVVPEKSSEKR